MPLSRRSWVEPVAISLVAGTKITPSSSGGTTPSIDTTGASLLVMGVTFYKVPAQPTPSDSKSNSWTGLTRKDSTEVGVRLFYVTNPTVGSGHTFTYSAAGIYATMFVLAFSGTLTASVFEAETGATTSGFVALAPGSITTAGNGRVLVSVVGSNGASGMPWTVDAGFTIHSQNSYAGGVNEGGGIAYYIQGTAAAINPTWSVSASPAAAMASFVPVASIKGLPIITHHHRQVWG